MKLPLIIVLACAAFLAVCIGVFVWSGRPQVQDDEPGAIGTPASQSADGAATSSETVPFAEETRVASVPANAEAAAPECDRGVADPNANERDMRAGIIADLTKETVIAAILRRADILADASAACVRTYFRTALLDDEDLAEFEAMSDERVVAMARFMAELTLEDRETAAEFRIRMLGPEAEWEYRGSEMRVGFEQQMQNGSVTTYQTATYADGSWY